MGLNAGNIVRMEFKVRNISTVEGRHQRRFDVGMPETQAVTELVGSYLEKIDSCNSTRRKIKWFLSNLYKWVKRNCSCKELNVTVYARL